MNNLIKDSWDFLKNNPNLYNVPILLFIISTILMPEFSMSMSYIFTITAIGCINMAFTAGWYNQIKVVMATKDKADVDDLLKGTGKYFNNILTGNIVLFVIFILTFILTYTVAEQFINISDQQLKDFEKIRTEIAKLNPEQLSNYMKNVHPEIITITYKWLFVFSTYFTIGAAFYFLIGLWTQISVFTGNNWMESWKKSFDIVRKNLRTYTALTFIQAWFTILFILVNLFSNDAFIQLLMIIISIVTETYFAVLFCLFVFRFNDNNKIELLKDDLQTSVSEIQRPDNKK